MDPIRFERSVSTVAHALAQLGLSVEALRLFTRLKAEESVLAILLESGFDIVEGGEKEAVRNALAILGREKRDSATACGLRGHLLLLEGAFKAAEAEMRRAMQGPSPEHFHMAVTRRFAMFCANTANYGEAVSLIEGLLERVGPGSADAIELHADLAAARGAGGDSVGAVSHAGFALERISSITFDRRAQVLSRVANAYFYARQHAQAEALANEAATLATQLGLDQLASRVYSLLYAIASEAHQDTTRAEFYARSMGVSAENAGDRQLRVGSLERLLQIATYRGDDEAIAAAEHELAQSDSIRPYRDTMEGRITRVIREVGRRNFRQARRFLEAMNLEELSTAETALRASLLCLCLIADDAHDQALAILEKPLLIEVEPDLYSRRYVSLARGYRALGCWMLGQGTLARRGTSGDLGAITEGERILLDAIASICGTKRAVASERVIHQLTEPLVALNFGGHARFLRSLAAVSYRPVELTRAEIDLLRSWRTGDTIHELADRIGKSYHTVNTQMRAICRKTGTSGRAEALAFARDNGII